MSINVHRKELSRIRDKKSKHGYRWFRWSNIYIPCGKQAERKESDYKAFVYRIIRSASKEAFISFLQQFAKKNPGFMTSVINREQLTWAK